MRICFVVLLAAATLLSSSEAISIPDKANNVAKVTVHDRDHVVDTQVLVKRSLRKRNTAVGDEERAVPTVASLERLDSLAEKVPGIIKKFGDRWAYRIMQYNVWIFGNKTPEWVKANFPAYFDGYFLFYHNRMTRGYKYA
ncbi:Secreted RxLR effector peptide protein [Phytophthora palmivora]|uniref:RxLR effector protein n=1 Tax=Phytophthora palmivora TaxID=4796 RepID=A0A2P4X588_9STRA|nr:Secreted RxLR effector peptide protein [Phytophthora palmivora]